MAKPARDAETFWEMAMPEPNSGCWLWLGTRHHTGYGRLKVRQRLIFAHRFAYELAKGPIPKGLHIDHRCSNRACVNPDHLDAVTQSENARRTIHRGRSKSVGVPGWRVTHCRHGHELTPENVYMRKWASGHPGRICRACTQARYERKRQRRCAELGR